MKPKDEVYQKYLSILSEELVPALGCTEPIAIAFASAKARELLGEMPESITVGCSGNIIKNTKAVVVPGTGNLRGIEVSAVLGCVGGQAWKKLEVLSDVTSENVEETKRLVKSGVCKIELLKNVPTLYIRVTMNKGAHSASVELQDGHANIVRTEKDGQVLMEQACGGGEQGETDAQAMCMAEIFAFADQVLVEDVQERLEAQITCNLALAEEGLRRPYGARVGASLLKYYGNGVDIRAKAYAAAGSDARMSGCMLPAVINSGSGNQGLTVSLPVIQFAQERNVSREQLYRALVLSNLTAIRLKRSIGKLSAYCGAVSAACGSAVGIAYLHGADRSVMEQTIVNTIACSSGIVCDGAKPSCAGKIACALDAALLAFRLAAEGLGYRDGEGIVKGNVEDTIESVGRMARYGMAKTDEEILKIMTE